MRSMFGCARARMASASTAKSGSTVSGVIRRTSHERPSAWTGRAANNDLSLGTGHLRDRGSPPQGTPVRGETCRLSGDSAQRCAKSVAGSALVIHLRNVTVTTLASVLIIDSD